MAELPVLMGAAQATVRDASPGTIGVAMVGAPGMSQNGSPSCPKSLSCMFRNPDGMHPVNWLLERYSRHSLVRLPNSAGISPVNWLP